MQAQERQAGARAGEPALEAGQASSLETRIGEIRPARRSDEKLGNVIDLGRYTVRGVVVVDGYIDENGHIRLHHHKPVGSYSKFYTFGLGRISGGIRPGQGKTVRLLLFTPTRRRVVPWTPIRWRVGRERVENGMIEVRVEGPAKGASAEDLPYLVIVPWEERFTPHWRNCQRRPTDEPVYRAKRVEKIATAYKETGSGLNATRVDLLLVWGDRLDMERGYRAWYHSRGSWPEICAGKYREKDSSVARWRVKRSVELG